jgi:hypothetical protein
LASANKLREKPIAWLFFQLKNIASAGFALALAIPSPFGAQQEFAMQRLLLVGCQWY